MCVAETAIGLLCQSQQDDNTKIQQDIMWLEYQEKLEHVLEHDMSKSNI